MITAIGKPMQNIRINMATAAFRISNGAGGGVLLNGTIIKVVTTQAKMPYINPVRMTFFDNNFILG